MQRIIILGCAGTGKTTMAKQLGKRLDMPVICLDALWRSPLEKKDLPAFRALIEQAHAGPRWVSDGNFAQATFDIRLPRATLVVWLECSKFWCMWRAITRVFKSAELHKIRKLGEVLAFIWNFDRINRPRIEALRLAHGSEIPVRRLFCGHDVAEFLSSCG